MPESQIGIPNRIIVGLVVSIDPKQAPEIIAAAQNGVPLSRHEIMSILEEWASVFKASMEEMPGVTVGVTMEEVI